MKSASIAPTTSRNRQPAACWARLTALSMAFMLVAPAVATAQSAVGHLRPVEPRSDQTLRLRAGHHNAGTRVLPSQDILLKTLPKTATFNVTYNGFTPAAESAFQHAVDIWAQLITSPVTIRVEANWLPLDPGLLGSASANRYWSNSIHVFPDALADSLFGSDLGGGDFDIFANFNSDFNWYLGTDANPAAGQYDFVTVVLHELGHGLGFSGLMTVDSGVGFWIFDEPSIYASVTEDLAGTNILDPVAYPDASTALGGVLESGNVFLAGTMAVAANAGVRPELYAPMSWEGGSSYSHLDEAAFPPGNPNSLMTPFLDFAEAIHSPGEIALCLFQDIGWTTTSSCTVAEGVPLSTLADLIVPGFEVEVDDPQGPTTFFAVRNTSNNTVDIDIAYHDAQATSIPLRTDLRTLSLQETATVNVRTNLTDLSVDNGFANGLILISEIGGSTGSLEGDFFRLDQANAFATGDRLVRPADFCVLQEVRFVEFGSGSELRILVDDPQGASQPSFTYTAYNEAGGTVTTGGFFTSNHLTVIDVTDLGIANPFGTLVLDFSNSGSGWVSAKYSAFGLFSVELNSACRD